MTTTKISIQKPTVNDVITFTPQIIDKINGNSYTWDQMTGLLIYNTDTTKTLIITITSKLDSSNKSKIIKEIIDPLKMSVINFLDIDFALGGTINVIYSGESTSGLIIPMAFTKP